MARYSLALGVVGRSAEPDSAGHYRFFRAGAEELVGNSESLSCSEGHEGDKRRELARRLAAEQLVDTAWDLFHVIETSHDVEGEEGIPGCASKSK